MQKSKFLVTAIVGATLGLGFVSNMSSAQAGSLIPQKEGEIKTNLGCIASTCIDTFKEFGYTVTSLGYEDSKGKKYGASRLFVDNKTTANNWGFGINFSKKDAGTNAAENQFWLRPVAVGKNGNAVENGQLEVGRFMFDFGKMFSEVTLSLFDVEDAFKTGVLEINGNKASELLAAGPDGSTQFITLKNVSSFVLQMGYRGSDSVFAGTGDGVNLSGIKTVPEPGNVASLSALAVVGMLALRQRQKLSQQAS
ncbi:MAG: LEVG family PEP-CTERM protein [Heteroscytonema crispum UTEX LB 1556]